MKSIKHPLYFFFIILLTSSFSFSARAKEFNVLNFGAKGDGKALETVAIQKAIDACSTSGGTVVFPSGTYLSGTIYLKDNVTLQLQKGATILGSTDLTHYPENLPEYTFFRKGVIKRALIHAERKENIAIEGEGIIDGQGSQFHEPKDKGVSSYSVRPYVIWMVQCKNVRVEGVKLQNSALWMQHYLACENVYIHNIEVYNHSNKNNDMMDIDGCKDVIISDCRGDTDDDGITLKSTHAQPNENITITNCILSSHCNAIKCGTESNAGFKNITISNCVIRPSNDREVIYGKPDGISGISLEVVDGAEMNGVNISDIIMDGPAVPLFVRLADRARGFDKSLPKPNVGSIQNINISNVTAFNAQSYGSSITGIPGHPVKNIHLENIRIYYAGGGAVEDALREIPEKESSYPEATMFEKLNAYGLFVRHVENISMSNLNFHLNANDHRPVITLDNVVNARLRDISGDCHTAANFIQSNNSKRLKISGVFPNNPIDTLLKINGPKSELISISDIDHSNINNPVQLGEGVDSHVVDIR